MIKVLPNRAAAYASVIITTQASQMDLNIPARGVLVEPLDPVAGVSLLYSFFDDEDHSWQITSIEQRSAATQLVDTCQGLPLHIVVAAMDIRATCTILDYVQQYCSVTVSELSTKSAWTCYSGMGPERVFDRAIALLEGGSWALIGMLSFLDGKHVARNMLMCQGTPWPPSLSFLHFGSFTLKDIKNVQAYSLVKNHITELGSFFEIHKAVQQRIRDIMSLEDPGSGVCNPTIDLRRHLGGLEISCERALCLLRSKLPEFTLYESPMSSPTTADAIESGVSHGLSFCDIVFQMGPRKWTDFPQFAKLSIDLVHLLWRQRNLCRALGILDQLENAMSQYSNLYDATLQVQIELLRSRLGRDRVERQDPERIEKALNLSKRIEVSVTSAENRETHIILVASLLAEVGFVQLIVGGMAKAQAMFTASIAEFSKLQKTEGNNSYSTAALAARVGLAFCELVSGHKGEACEEARSIYSSLDLSVIHNFGSHRLAFSVAELLASVGLRAEAMSLHQGIRLTRQTFCGAENPLTLQSQQALAKSRPKSKAHNRLGIKSLQCS